MKVSQHGGEAEQLAMFPAETGATGIVCDGAFVYWSLYMSGTVSKVPVGGGPVTLLTGNSKNLVYALAQDDINVYWVSDSRAEMRDIVKASKSGGGVSTVTSYKGPSTIVADAGYLYFGTSEHEVARAARDGGAVTTFPTSGHAEPFATNDGQLYFTERDRILVSSIPIAGGPVTELFSLPDSPKPVRFNDSYIYFAGFDGLHRHSLSSGTDEPFVTFKDERGVALHDYAFGKTQVFLAWGRHLYVAPAHVP